MYGTGEAVASEGRATRGTEAGADISVWLPPDAMEAGSKMSEILLSGKISDSFDSRGGEQLRRGVASICNEPAQS